MAQNMCNICHDCIESPAGGEALACGHLYHGECLDHYTEVVGEPRRTMRCPVCRVSNDTLLGAENALMNAGGPMLINSDASANETAEPEADNETAEPEADN